MIIGSHRAAWCVSGVLREAQIAVPPNGARRGARTEIVMRVIEEESRPETLPTTGEEGTQSGIAETTEREVRVRVCLFLSL